MRKVLGLVLILAVVAAWSVPPVPAAGYKPEYKLSTDVGAPLAWGLTGEK
jgi:hypothetical protein